MDETGVLLDYAKRFYRACDTTQSVVMLRQIRRLSVRLSARP